MKFFSRVNQLLLAFLVALSLFACSGKTETIVDQTKKSFIHEKIGKPGAAIKLISPSSISAEPNQTTNIDILLEATESTGVLTIEFNQTQGLELVSSPNRQTINLPSSSPIKIPVSFVSSANGRYYLNIHATINNNDLVAVRNFAVIVEVGPQSNPSASTSLQLKKSSGENVISLPAQESISPK